MADQVTCRCYEEELRFSFRAEGCGDFYCCGTLTDPGPVRVHKGQLMRFENRKPVIYCADHFSRKWKIHKEGCEIVAAFQGSIGCEG